MGIIKVENIRVFAHHGCLNEETKIGSDYRVDLEVKANLNKSAKTDDLNDTVDYVLLKIDVERSSATPGQITTEIFKQTANTEVLMLDGEETVIGGLFINEDISTRRGIPFLKDLPWWVFGIRYLTGYDSESTTKKEVVILIKTEIIPTLKERVTMDKGNPIKDEIKNSNAFMEKYKFKNKSDDSED